MYTQSIHKMTIQDNRSDTYAHRITVVPRILYWFGHTNKLATPCHEVSRTLCGTELKMERDRGTRLV